MLNKQRLSLPMKVLLLLITGISETIGTLNTHPKHQDIETHPGSSACPHSQASQWRAGMDSSRKSFPFHPLHFSDAPIYPACYWLYMVANSQAKDPLHCTNNREWLLAHYQWQTMTTASWKALPFGYAVSHVTWNMKSIVIFHSSGSKSEY